jgi:hypothetical protein
MKKFSSINTKVLQKLSNLGKTSLTVFPSPKVAPTPAFFDQLKEAERRTFSRKRHRFEYEENYTAALALPHSSSSLARIKKNEPALLSLAQSNIIEHANRRVDLFFYTLIAYYHTNALPAEGHTTLQHGRGRTLRDNTNVTQGCHSSIIPSFLDQSIYKKGKKRTKSLLSTTHFLENLNSTVELPHFVNAFDDFLEAICRTRCMEIRKVSLGKLNPIEGLEQFLIMMSNTLQEFKKQAASTTYSSLKYPSVVTHPYVQPKLIDLVIKGTLGTTFSTETCTANEEYVQLMLRMTPKEKDLCGRYPENKATLYLQKIIAMQQEILKTKSDERSYTI